jgi:hypothetical protein
MTDKSLMCITLKNAIDPLIKQKEMLDRLNEKTKGSIDYNNKEFGVIFDMIRMQHMNMTNLGCPDIPPLPNMPVVSADAPSILKMENIV